MAENKKAENKKPKDPNAITSMKLKCSICGQVKAAGKKRVEYNIKKYGSKEKLMEKYVCRTCRKKARDEERKKKAVEKAKKTSEAKKKDGTKK